MNKKLILTCLLALNCAVFAAEQKNESNQARTEGELLLEVLKRYGADTLSKELMLQFWSAAPANPDIVAGKQLWEVTLPANATHAGTALLSEPKVIATNGYSCSGCPQMRTYKLPAWQNKDGIGYTQAMFCSMFANGKFAMTLDSRSLFGCENHFRSPMTIVYSPAMAHLVKEALGVDCRCKKFFVLQAAQEKSTASSDAAKA